jgi:phosphoenolpyruvate-protein kinase (PTS system EI component)
LGIPAVSGIEHIHDVVACGTELIVNGDTGEVILWPTAETCRRCVAPVRPRIRVTVPEPVEGLRVMANIGRAAEVKDARTMKAEGIGLYRTELEMFAAGHLLTEDEQFTRYASVVKAMDSKPVYFRMLDVGGDKPLPLVEVLKEANPSLGLRGARFLLSHPELLRTQARALARVSRLRPIHVMYPMVIDLAQFRRLRKVFEESVADLPSGRIFHGVMFEVPSAILEARELLEAADFGSIGTNDLVQFVFAVDRNNERVAEDYFFDRPVLWKLIEDLVRTANEVGRPLSLCGELAAEPRFTERLISMGISAISVSARHIPTVRRAARQALHKKLQTHV